MRVALAQVAPVLGNIEANLRMHREAAAAGADLIVFPGPPPPKAGRTR